jgi:hypothetical protein
MIDDERRRLLKLLVAAGVLAGTAETQSETLTPEMLDRAMKLFEGELDEERLRAVLPAVQRNVDFFRIVRELEIEDDVEPAPIFHARRPEGVR